MAKSTKTSISLSAHSIRALERNQFAPDRSARINEVIARYDMLITREREAVAHLAEHEFLGFVVGEWLEAYPIQMGLLNIVQTVYEDRKFDGFDVPDDADFEALMSELTKLNFAQEMALVEMIEAAQA